MARIFGASAGLPQRLMTYAGLIAEQVSQRMGGELVRGFHIGLDGQFFCPNQRDMTGQTICGDLIR